MKTLFIDFNAKCQQNSIYKLFEIINKYSCNKIILRISSNEGNTFAGVLAFNKLNAISQNIELITYNSSSISASALPMYYAGNKRYAAGISSFHIGQNQWSNSNRDVDELTEDYDRYLAFDKSITKIFKYQNNLYNFDIEHKFHNSERITIEEALETRLVHEIRENIYTLFAYEDYTHFMISHESEDSPPKINQIK